MQPGDVVLMMEVVEEATYVKHHKQKLTLIFSAMRHFAEELRRDGFTVDYVRLDDPANTGAFTSEVQRAIARHRAIARRRHRTRRMARAGDDEGLGRGDPRRRPLLRQPRRASPPGPRAASSSAWNSSTARCAAPRAC